MNYSMYLLMCLAEECNELSQRAIKSLRFGISDTYDGLDNWMHMIREYSDLQAVVQELGLISDKKDIELKLKRLKEYYNNISMNITEKDYDLNVP